MAHRSIVTNSANNCEDLDRLLVELQKEIGTLLSMDDSEFSRLIGKLAKYIQLAQKCESALHEGKAHLIACMVPRLPTSDREAHAKKAESILENLDDKLAFADSLYAHAVIRREVLGISEEVDCDRLRRAIVIYEPVDRWGYYDKIRELEGILEEWNC